MKLYFSTQKPAQFLFKFNQHLFIILCDVLRGCCILLYIFLIRTSRTLNNCIFNTFKSFYETNSNGKLMTAEVIVGEIAILIEIRQN